jgi:hypothetical protein
MRTAKQIHDEAMLSYEEALASKIRGEYEKYHKLVNQALDLEMEAAMMLSEKREIEPTRAMLFRSAASMAYHARRFKEAEKMVAFGLTGDPPEQIAHQLRELFDLISFGRHLSLVGARLDDDEFKFVIHGPAIASGWGKTSEVAPRLEIVQELYTRTMEREQGNAYRTSKNTADSVGSIYLGPSMAASYGIILKITRPFEDETLFPYTAPTKYLDNLLENVELLNEGRYDDLHDKLPDESYYTNFITKARNLAPDGDNVKLVGFSVQRSENERQFEFSRKKSEINLVNRKTFPVSNLDPENPVSVMERVRGRFKDLQGSKGMIRFVPSGKFKKGDKRFHDLHVLNIVMKELVQEYYDEEIDVIIERFEGDGKEVLRDIISKNG